VLALLLAAPSPGRAEAGEALALVVHAEWSGIESLSIPVLRQIYLGRRTRLAGRPVLCTDLPAGSLARTAFAREVLRLDERALDRYWLRQALAGGPPPPREVDTAAAVIARVAEVPGAIGYVPWRVVSSGPPEGTRILPLAVDGRLLAPADPAYPLRLPQVVEPAS
jgi:ABC-type phosphate transport system substrate-binding protein